MNIKGNFLMCLAITVLCTVPLHSKRPKRIRANRFKKTTNNKVQEKTQAQKNDSEVDTTEESRIHLIESKPSKPPYPPTATDDKDDMIEVNLQNTDLQNVLNWIEDVFKVKFLTNDTIQPPAQGGSITGNKINFKTHRPLTKKQVWDLFLTFLDLFGFALSEGSIPNFYKVRPTATGVPNSISKSPLDSYINVHWSELPNNDTPIRFIYFVRNSTLATIQSIVDPFRSQTSLLKTFQDLNAFILTDKSSNVRSIMQVVEELDSTSMPEAMSVLKLKNADAADVVTLYTNLTKTEDPRGLAARILGTKKQPTTIYFPESLRLIAESRTNTLIILGDKEGIKKVEEFIIDYVDVELKVPYSPLYVYELQYTNAEDIVTILQAVTQFTGGSPTAAQYGGVREGDKYLQPMTFTAEKSGNRILIRGEKEDYLKVRDVIRQLDVKQPQIAIEVLIVNVISTDNRELGIQIRNKDPETISNNLDFQTSGFPLRATRSAPVINTTTGSLLGNLITLAQNQTPGATLISIANNAAGVWGILKVLQNRVHTSIVANPFLITTNNYPAQVSVGETRRVVSADIAAVRNVQAQDDVEANLMVKITPQINSIGIISLDITINIDTFVDATNQTSANTDKKSIRTFANVGNRQVLALGGLLKTNHDESISKVPLLGDVPLLGWFFKNKTKVKEKDNLLVFISPRIVEPRLEGGMNSYTKEKVNIAKNIMGEAHHPAELRDPIHRWFFKDEQCEDTEYIDNFITKQNPEECIDIPESLYCTESCVEEGLCAMNETPADTEEQRHKPVVNNPVVIAESSKTAKKNRSITNLLPLEKQEVST